MKLRAPAVPLITVDPYFSVWAPDVRLNAANTMHWTGASNNIVGLITVDGKKYSIFGYHRNHYKMKQVSLDIDALSTTAVYEADGIRVIASFLTPLLPRDYERFTRPVSYLSLSYTVLDGAGHDVSAEVYATEELCLDRPKTSPVEFTEIVCGDCAGYKIGNTVQNPLNRDGDDLRIDWGYFYLVAQSGNVTRFTDTYHGKTQIHVGSPMKENTKLLYLFAYDDLGQSIEYFGARLKSYWNRNGKTIETAIKEAAADYDALLPVCADFSKKLYDDANEAGGEKYAEILSLAYRQVIAGHKLVLNEEGEILYISKECFSNGCAATVDVSYPSIPLFLLYNPELIIGMMRPIYKFAASKEWKYDFAPHDAGRYPLVNGQKYGMEIQHQMPVEECGNMLIMETNVALANGSADYAASHFDTLVKWCKYLIKFGIDPENQLCTDDFAGHLAHNCNLTLKAAMGIEGMSLLCKMLGKEKEAASYHRKARKIAKHYTEYAVDENGYSRLAYDQPGTYSQKYNMVWDKVWNTGLFSQKSRNTEIKHNTEIFNEYGMPLDSRTDYTKSDWMVWTATMAPSKKAFEAFVAPLWKAYNESPSRVPLTDWYDTVTAREVSFQHRTVQGGLFMKVLDYKGTLKRK